MNGLRLRSNPTASLAYRNLSKTQFSLNNTLQRLSSGLRINKAADDSAGSAISTRMNSQITGMKQANRNAQDVNHLIQTTEGGLNDISGILNRMRELALQAATDTLNNSDRASIDLEYQALKDEVNRIANATQYNEMNVLNVKGILTYEQEVANAKQTMEATQTAKSDAETTLSQAKTALTEAQADISSSRATAFSQTQTMFDDAVTALVSIVPSTTPVERTIELINVDNNGNHTIANAGGYNPQISGDGRYVTFSSNTNNLVDGDTNGKHDIFVRDRQTETTERISVDTYGNQGNVDIQYSSISEDGNYVAFSSSDIFVRNRETGITERVNIHSDGTESNDPSQFIHYRRPSISGNGRYVTFRSEASNLVDGDNNGQPDIFVHDRQTGTTERVNIHSNGNEANNNYSSTSNISEDGRYVTFVSNANNLVDGDTNGIIAVEDIFVHDRQTGTTERVNIHSDGTEAGFSNNYSPRLSGDGRYVAFGSNADNLVDGDTNGQHDIFVHDRQTGTTERVNTHSNGIEANSYSGAPNLSGDGRYVVFESHANNLVDDDNNKTGNYGNDIFVHDRETGITARVSILPDGTEANGYSADPNISGDGRYVAFRSESSNLVDGIVTSGLGNIYVASNPLFSESNDNFPQAQNKVALAKTAFEDAQATLNSPEVSNANIVSSLDSAETLLDDAISALNALGSEDIDSGDLPSVLTQFNSLKTAYSGMKTMLQDAESQLTQLATDVGNAESTLATRESELTTAQTALTDTETILASANNPSSRTFQIGADNDINNQLDFNLVDATTEAIGVDGTDVVNLGNARSSITALDHATDIINSERSRLGSIQNKLQFTMSNLTSQTQSIEAARSSIQDTDFAADAADLAKNQILAQSGTAMLAQASAISQNILSLIAA